MSFVDMLESIMVFGGKCTMNSNCLSVVEEANNYIDVSNMVMCTCHFH
jgi:hypothetical protein